MPFTEFCCRSGGSNLNAGTRTGNSAEPGTAADFTYASGSWVQSTGVFTVASGNPSSDGVAVGDFASVYADGSTVTGFVGRVTARDATTITVSLTAKSGTAPTDGTGNRTLTIGGAWKGPNGAEQFPFNFVASACTNSAGDFVRCNFKNDAQYDITAAMSHGLTGPIRFRGYSSSYGDGGRATIDGGTSGASYTLLSVNTSTNPGIRISNFVFQNNGATGTADGVGVAQGVRLVRCAVNNVRGSGVNCGNQGVCLECEAYSCNQSNTVGKGGFQSGGSGVRWIRCVAHDNTSDGFIFIDNSTTQNAMHHCVSESNTRYGAWVRSRLSNKEIVGCDFYNNGADGVLIANTTDSSEIHIESCNFLKNGGYGIRDGSTVAALVTVINCGFGSGTQANTSGKFSGVANDEATVDYAADVTPWADPANGDFRITLAAAKGAGRGAFTQTAAGYSGTVGYPDIGAAQHQDSGTAGARVIGGGVG